MERDRIITRLRACEPELRAAGVASLSLFGSVARGEDRAGSDIDIALRLSPAAAQGGLAYFSRLDAIHRRLQAITGRPVDLVAEPVRKERLRRSIERDRTVAF